MIRDNQQPMRIAFRADASVEIGTGHVMRCLTLADALHNDATTCLFLCRPHDGHLLELITARGHQAIALPPYETDIASLDPDAPAHAHWLGTDWATDANDSRRALNGAVMDWLVVDHYALDRRWEQTMRPACRHLLAIDDLADRPHDCELLLDQNLGRGAEDYRDLLPPNAKALIGPRYALLRSEFAALRAESLARRERPEFKHLLLTMGGVDKDNATGAVLDALQSCDLPSELRITVVMGPHAPFLAQVRAKASAMSHPTRVLTGVSDMARLMLEADLAIGAAGSTSWERCCLGLPTIQLVLAENQTMIANALAQGGITISIGIASLSHSLPDIFKDKRLTDRLLMQGRNAGSIVDGRGSERIVRLLQGMER